jgi:hypothetical protein
MIYPRKTVHLLEQPALDADRYDNGAASNLGTPAARCGPTVQRFVARAQRPTREPALVDGWRAVVFCNFGVLLGIGKRHESFVFGFRLLHVSEPAFNWTFVGR